MTPKEAVDYIENYTWSTTHVGLERTKTLLAALGNPQEKLKFIHVTGSNGKGSTCAILDSVMKKAGYKTGLYISPYLVDFTERIQINTVPIPGEDLARITERVRVIADSMEEHPSQFELVTAIAMVYFFECRCDIVILEVGMGGALDSTNVIPAPEAAVFTNIGLEHTEYLGDTIEAIAETKGGIIKKGCDCVIYDGAPEATDVLINICQRLNVPYRLADMKNIEPLSHSIDGQLLKYKGREYSFPLLGEHQLHNLNVALEVIEVMQKRGFIISEEAAYVGVAEVFWPARFQVLTKEPVTFILDGGHNPQCAEALANIIRDYMPDEKITFLIGVLADKDYKSMLASVMPYAARFVCITPDSPRALDNRLLAEAITENGYEAICCPSVEEAIRYTCSCGNTVVAFGSLYMAGDVLKLCRSE